LYRYETLSATLREQDRLRVFGNKVMKKIFGPYRKGMEKSWIKLNDEGR
jgi:hypothetical protein